MRVGGTITLAALSLLLLPGAALAKLASGSVHVNRRIEFRMRASHGYRLTISGAASDSPKVPNIYVTATKGQHYSVQYVVRGTATREGVLKTKLPGVGRIAVRFEARKVTRPPIPDNCTGPRNVVAHGVFRGVIDFEGEQGFTSVHRRGAQGKLSESFPKVCHEHESKGGKGAPQPRIRQAVLLAGSESEGRSINFNASRIDFGLGDGPSASYSASSTVRHDGMFVWTVVSELDDSTGFSTPDPAGVLEDATVEPPYPFTGSATFHLDSSHSSSWTGTLAVEMPGIGPVSLTEPKFWSALCEEATCTKTFPPNVRIGFISGTVQLSG